MEFFAEQCTLDMPRGPSVLKAAIYARYSSALQHPSSIEDQVALCRQHASRFACTVLDEHLYSDSEISGSDTCRDGYQRLLAAARAKAFDAIIVEGQDRLWRNQAEMHTALRRLQFWGIKVFSVATAADLTDKAGRLIATVVGWKDEAYLDDLRDKTRRGLAGQVRRGFSAGGRTYGYHTKGITDSTRLDAHGQPRVAGYRRAIVEQEASAVRSIFEEYARGRSPKAIARDLNRDRVPPPRGPRVKGWTWTAFVGNPRLGTGILNNTLYIGKLIWNRFRWERDPETGKRVPRLRPQDDWVMAEQPELRIVPQELWDRVKARQGENARRLAARPSSRGRGPKYLLSGLLKCGLCGGNYIIYNSTYYGCSFHTNRGPDICSNGKVVRRAHIEERLLHVIKEELFTPEALAYLTDRVQEEIKRLTEKIQDRSDRHTLEQELAEALREREYVKDAIRRGLIGDITQEMLEEVEARVRGLQGRLAARQPLEAVGASALPEVIQKKLQELDKVLGHDVDRARGLLRDLLGQIVIRPTSESLVAELRGNVEGLLALEEALPGLTGNSGSGGWI